MYLRNIAARFLGGANRSFNNLFVRPSPLLRFMEREWTCVLQFGTYSFIVSECFLAIVRHLIVYLLQPQISC